MKLLFHCCCAPCAAGCLDLLACEGIAPELFWYNPNIHPYTEYKNRRDSLIQFAAARGLNCTSIDVYGLRQFIRSVYAVTESAPQPETAPRCARCYRLRLEQTAARAAEQGFEAFSTSLLVSPYQQHETIRAIGGELAEQYRVPFYYRDFRPHFRAGQAAARTRSLYMQKYCGCIFSEEERYLP